MFNRNTGIVLLVALAAGALIGNEVGRNNDRGYRHRH